MGWALLAGLIVHVLQLYVDEGFDVLSCGFGTFYDWDTVL